MIPQLYRVHSESDVAHVAKEIIRRLKYSGPCDCYVTEVGAKDERSKWMARYHKLMELLSKDVRIDGDQFTPTRWDIELKAKLLTAEEYRLMDGRIHYQLPSKRDMSREQRDSFLEQCQEYAAEFGVFLTHKEEQT